MASAAACIAAVSCTIESEDAFSTAPAAPVMDVHSDILITTETKNEAVTFSWSAARFIDTDVYTYDLYVKFGEKEVSLGSNIKETYYTSTKTAFRDFLKSNFDLEQNSTHSIAVYASIKDNAGKVYKSSEIALKVYVYDEAVASVLTSSVNEIVLDKENPAGTVEKLLEWSDARLVYGEDITYNVVLKLGDGDEKVLASGLYATSWSTTIDALNEAVVSAGGAEDAANDVTFIVYACCPSIPEGVPSNVATVNVTTYVATFPEKVWVVGSFQGWAPASGVIINASQKTKGMYQGFVDLTTADGSNAEFKFCIQPAWDGDFGFEDVSVETKGEGELAFATANSSTVGASNVSVPSGFYYILLDKKFGTLTMIQVHNLEMMGSFNGWSAGMPMTWNAENRIWTATENVTVAENEPMEYKFRFNSDWTYSIGVNEKGDVAFQGGNAKIEKASSYKISLDASSSDFVINALDLNMPEYLTMPGDYSGHSWNINDDFRLYLKDADNGIYMGTVTMYGTTHGFKFGKVAEWLGMTGSVAEGFKIEGDANGMVADGTYAWTVNLSTNSATAVPVTSVGIIGSFAASNWGSDVEMTFDAETLTYSAEVTFAAGNEWKFRFNNDWTFNYGLNDGMLRQDGANIVAEAGTYVITLDMAHGSNPSYTVVAK